MLEENKQELGTDEVDGNEAGNDLGAADTAGPSSNDPSKKAPSALPTNFSKQKLAKQIAALRQDQFKLNNHLNGLPRVLGMIVQQSIQPMQKKIDVVLSSLSDLNARINSIKELAGIDDSLFNAKVDEIKIRDFDEMAAKKDKDGNIVIDEDGIVKDDSIVVAKIEDKDEPDNCLLRTTIDLNEPEHKRMLSSKLVGKKIGESIEICIDEDKKDRIHNLTVLQIKKKNK